MFCKFFIVVSNFSLALARFSLKNAIRDKREFKFFWQRLTLGFSSDEMWNLDNTIAEFVLPRLKYFRHLETGFPGCFDNAEQWYNLLDKMIYAMDMIAKGEHYVCDQSEYKRIQEGNDLFGKWFRSLWW
jgi:hypothetical protein